MSKTKRTTKPKLHVERKWGLLFTIDGKSQFDSLTYDTERDAEEDVYDPDQEAVPIEIRQLPRRKSKHG